MSYQIDDIDKKIIGYLQEDGRASASEIAQKIGKVSERTIRNRITALLGSRQIVVSAIPDPTLTEPEVLAEVHIDVAPGKVESVAALLREYDEIGYLAAVSGEYSLSALLSGSTLPELHAFSETTIAEMDGVRKVSLSFVMRLYKVFGTRTSTFGGVTGTSNLLSSDRSS